MKFGIIIAARMSSRRLPGKALLPLMGLPIICLLIKRLKTSKLADKFIFATSDQPEDDVLAEAVKNEGIEIFRGPLDDVLHRYVLAARGQKFDYCVRVTGDEPFVNGETLDYIISQCQALKSFDLVTTKPAFPQGIDYEVYPKALLEKIDREMNPTAEEREHVTYYIYQKEENNNYNIRHIEPPPGLELNERVFLLDTPEDYEALKKLVQGIEDIQVKPEELIKKYKNEL